MRRLRAVCRACPQVGGNEFDMGLKARKAIYRPFPQSVPAAYVIDPSACLNFCGYLTERSRRSAQEDREVQAEAGPRLPAQYPAVRPLHGGL